MLLRATLVLAMAGTAQAQTMVEQVGAAQISTTLQQSAPVIKPPAVITPSTPAAEAGATTPSVPSTPPSPAFLAALDTAQKSYQAGNYRQAQTQYEALVGQNYQNAQAHFGLGLTLFALNDLAGARFEFGQLSALDPASFEGPYNLGVVASRQNQNDEALADFAKAAELARGKVSAPVLRQVLEALAGEQARARNYPALATTLAELVKTAPDDLDLQVREAQALTLAGQGTAALPLLYAVRAKAPANVDAALLTADIYASQQLADRGVRELDSAVAATQDSAARGRLLLRKADLLAGLSRSKDALQAVQAAVKADPRNAAAQARLGELLVARSDRGGALSAWQTAVKLEPVNALYRTNLAAVRLSLSQYAAAAQDARLALRASPDAATQARAQLVLGVASYRLGRYSEARSALQSSALAAPGAEASLWLGLSSYALKDYAGAVTALSESVRLQPTPNARLNLGSALLSSGRYAEAETVLRALVVEQPKNAEGWYQLGLARRAQGKTAEATSALKTAANLGNSKAQGSLK
ncbi:tetratricopeptide repeat protein [Deinococcus sonorensis]|uniref:Tetratricopeptide repeat protein n=2 Tax=Deinococcus sonorensis TaxID=309891 RepID=A0AAU7UA23_9DEIO